MSIKEGNDMAARKQAASDHNRSSAAMEKGVAHMTRTVLGFQMATGTHLTRSVTGSLA